MSTNVQYHYITLNRILDVASGEFELSIGGDTVYRLDTNDSTVNLQLNDRGNDKIPLISKRRIDVGSGGFDKIIISWTGLSVPQTLQLLIGDSQKRSDVVGVELSDFSTTVTGSTTTDLVKIGGSTNTVGAYFPVTNSTGSTAGSLNLSASTTSDTTILTVPANFIFLLSSCTMALDDSSGVAFCQIKHQFSGGTGETTLLGAVANSNTASQNLISRSFPIPFVAPAGSLIIISDGGGSATPAGAISGSLVAV